MGYLLGIAVSVVIALIMAAASSSKKDTAPTVVQPLSERPTEELKKLLQEAENDVEMQKIQYQASLSNPYVSHIVRNLSKSNLNSAIARKSRIAELLEGRMTAATPIVENIQPTENPASDNEND